MSNAAGTAFYDNNKNFISAIASNVYSFTTPNNTKYIRISLNSETPTSVMLVKGSTAPTTYVEHEEQRHSISLGNIELCSTPDGTVRDYIYGTPDNWFKKVLIGKAVLDGSVDENWTASSTYLGNYYLPSGLSNTFTQADLLCNYFIKMPNGDVSQNYRQGLCFIENPNGTIDCWYDDGTATLEQFKTRLSTHNLIIYYQLATSVDVQITDSTLIEQLNNIYNDAYSYNGTTNVTTTYANGNEQMYLDFEALMDLNSLVTRIETLESEV